VIVATRSQLPLDLAWAFSVHKSQVCVPVCMCVCVSVCVLMIVRQGMSLDYLRVSLSKCFEAGQG
jgi:hypothetical protein